MNKHCKAPTGRGCCPDKEDPRPELWCIQARLALGMTEETEPEDRPTGTCENCGDLTYNGKAFCSAKCREEWFEWVR